MAWDQTLTQITTLAWKLMPLPFTSPYPQANECRDFGSSLGLLFQSWASGFHCQDAFWLAFNKKAWKELQLKFVNKTDKMTSLRLPPPPPPQFLLCLENQFLTMFPRSKKSMLLLPICLISRTFFCLEHIGLTHGSCQICCLAICKTAHLLTKQGHKYPIYLWRKVVCFVLFCSYEIHWTRMLQIMFLVSLESSPRGGVHGLGSMTFGLAVQKFLNIEWILH